MSARLCRLTTVAIVLFVSGSASGQATAPASKPASRPMPALTPARIDQGVLKDLPEDCLAFVVIHDVKDFTGRIDAFIRRVAPKSADMGEFRILDKFTEEIELGKSFDPAGTFAIVLLEPKKYGPDFLKAIQKKPAPAATQKAQDSGEDEQPGADEEDTPEIEPNDLPVAFVIPGKDAMTMFEKHNPSKDGQYVKISGDSGATAWYAREVAGGVAVAPRKAILDAFGAGKSILAHLSPTEQAAIARNGAAAWVDFKTLRPLLRETRLGKLLVRAFADAPGPFYMLEALPFGFIAKYIYATRGESLSQAESRVFAARVVEEGLVFEVRGRYPADSPVAKVMAGFAPPDKLLGALPNMPYIFAAGGSKGLKVPPELRAKQIDKLLSDEPFKKLTKPVKDKIRQVMTGVGEQVQSAQWYAGQVTSGQGMFAVACVVDCADAAAFKKLLETGAAAVPEMLKEWESDAFGELTIKYTAALEQVGQVKADAIVIDHPELARMDDEARNKMRAIIGDDKFRLLVAEAGKNRVVVTFGGGVAFMKEALKTAEGSGKLEDDPGAKKALAMLPKDRLAVGMFNVGNMWTMYMNMAASVMGEPIPPAMRTLDAPVPIAGAFAAEKNELSFTLFVPVETISALIKTVSGGFEAMMESSGEAADDVEEAE